MKVFRVYYDAAACSTSVIECDEDSRHRDYGDPHDTMLMEFNTREEAEKYAETLRKDCPAYSDPNAYCYTHNPGGER